MEKKVFMLSGENGIVTVDPVKRVVTKRARLVAGDADWLNGRRLYSLSRDFLFLKLLGDGKHVPRAFGLTVEEAVVCGNPVRLVKEIRMEFAGPTLHDCRVEGFLMSPAVLLRGILEACAYLHGKGVIHFDIKINNITVCMETGRPKLIDFGVSELTAEDVTKKYAVQRLDKLGSGLLWGNEEMGRTLGDGLFFYQNSFTHNAAGGTRVSTEVNHPTFRDPTLLCADHLRVGGSVANDARVDVYSAAASVVAYMGWLDYCAKVATERDCLKHLDQIHSMVGSIDRPDVWKFRNELMKAAAQCGMAGSLNVGLLLAMQCRLAEPPAFQGLLCDTGAVAEVYGRAFAKCARSAMHPVNVCRPFAFECWGSLAEEGRHEGATQTPEVYRGQTDLAVFPGPRSHVVAQIRAKGLCIVSVCVGPGDKMLWCTALRGVDSGPKLELVHRLHARVCSCGQSSHAKVWYSSLDRRSRCCQRVFPEYPLV